MATTPASSEHRVETAVTVDRSDPRLPRTYWWWRCSCFPEHEFRPAPSPEAAERAHKSHLLLEAMK